MWSIALSRPTTKAITCLRLHGRLRKRCSLCPEIPPATPDMRVIQVVGELRAWSREARAAGRSVGLVPTMGALHAGHISLVRAAKASCEVVAASIFVNPTQFGPNEDFALYPRTFEADCALLEAEGVDVVFAPSA